MNYKKRYQEYCNKVKLLDRKPEPYLIWSKRIKKEDILKKIGKQAEKDYKQELKEENE